MLTNEEHNATDRAFPVRPFLASSKPESNEHRLARFGWKTGRNGEKPLSSTLFVSIPSITISVTPAILQSSLQSAFQDMQDAMMKETIETRIKEGKPAGSFHASDLTIEAVAAWNQEQSSNRGKLSKEIIEDWFADCVRDPLQEALAQLTAIETDEQLTNATNARKIGFLKLAAPTFSMVENDARQLLKAIDLIPANNDATSNSTTAKISARLTNYLKPTNELMAEML